MCSVAPDRAVKPAGELRGGARAQEWAVQRDAILERAYDDEAGVYAGTFDSDRLEASVLLMAMMGLVPADDERMLADDPRDRP